MNLGIYQSAAGMMTQQHRMDVLSNNLANAETAGFKRDIAVLAERKPASDAGVRSGPTAEALRSLSGGVWLGETETDHSAGGIQATGESLDVAILGPGFLTIEKEGRTLLTRDGRMTMTADGALVAVSDGSPILGVAGQPIRLNRYGGTPTIDETGRITQNGIETGRLDLASVDDPRRMHKVGGGRFALGSAQLTEEPVQVLGGHIERSGVEPVRELVSMMQASRAYQFNAQMITLQDQTAGRLISTVAS